MARWMRRVVPFPFCLLSTLVKVILLPQQPAVKAKFECNGSVLCSCQIDKYGTSRKSSWFCNNLKKILMIRYLQNDLIHG